MKNLKKYIEKYKETYTYENPNSLSDLIRELQKYITFAFNIEGKTPPKLILNNTPDKKGETTLAYSEPLLYISLSKRISRNIENTKNTFQDAHLTSGYPKNIKKINISSDGKNEYFVDQAIIETDNELLLSLKTKTVKEQFEYINTLERALNIYANKIKSKLIVACGIKMISTENEINSQGLIVSNITFHVLLREIIIIDETYILKGFEIYDGKDITFATGKLINDKWQEYKTNEFEIF